MFVTKSYDKMFMKFCKSCHESCHESCRKFGEKTCFPERGGGGEKHDFSEKYTPLIMTQRVKEFRGSRCFDRLNLTLLGIMDIFSLLRTEICKPD